MGKDKETKGISAVMIIEVMGTPPEHLNETLEIIIKKIDEEKGVSVITKKINESREMEKHKGFYNNFAEIEVEVEDVLYLVILMFKYMPSHIEIIQPELIALTNNGWNDVLNELTRRLHGYDEIARILQLEKGIFETKLREVLGDKGFEEEIKKINEKYKEVDKKANKKTLDKTPKKQFKKNNRK